MPAANSRKEQMREFCLQQDTIMAMSNDFSSELPIFACFKCVRVYVW